MMTIDNAYVERKIAAMKAPGTLNPSIRADVRAALERQEKVVLDPDLTFQHTRNVVIEEIERFHDQQA